MLELSTPQRRPRRLRPTPVGRRMASAGALAILLLAPATVPAQVPNDTTGDTLGQGPGQVDADRLTLESLGDAFVVEIGFASPVEQPGLALSALAGIIDLDIDADAATGALAASDFLFQRGAQRQLGSELQIPLASLSNGALEVVDTASGDVVGSATADLGARTLRAQLPAHLIPDARTVRAVAALGTTEQLTDVVPNDGFVSTEAAAASAVELRNGRFSVDVSWEDYQGGTGRGQLAHRSADSALFWFFDAQNWELMVKVLDGCGLNGHFWVYAGATTDVAYTLRVTDTATGTVRTYSNALGERQPFVGDTQAFSTCS